MGEQRMNDAEDRASALEMRVVRALETRPEVSLPTDFAVRVASRVPARREVAVPPARYGMIAVQVAMAVLVVALVVLGVRSTGHGTVGMAVEWILCGQLVALALWRSGAWKRDTSDV
jgi:hypothetical protein